MDKESTKLYGECAYVMNNIFNKCESMINGWDELLNYLGSIDDTQFENERDFYYYYFKFLNFIYWRIHTWTEPQKFNKVRRKEVEKKVDGKIKKVPGFSIWNYDYKMFLWALNHHHTYGMNPSMIDVAEEDLTPAELKRFEKKAEENK